VCRPKITEMMPERESLPARAAFPENAVITIVINYLRLYTSRQDVALWVPINRNAPPDVLFLIPSSQKGWNDHVVCAGKTVNYSGSSIERLAKGKKAIRVLASGGIFSEGPWKGWDSVEPNPGQILRIIAIVDIHRACRGHEHTTASDPCDTQR
jgi:hypothetical protein